MLNNEAHALSIKEETMNILIAFFSRSDENYFGYEKRYVAVGNTEIAAEKAGKLTGADMFQISMKKPYSKEYDACMRESREDKLNNARPELVSLPESIDGYSTIILAYPNYWKTMPMAVFTFLEAFDFTGKTILPLCTNEGDDLGRSVEDIKRACPGANVAEGISLCGTGIESSDPFIERWLRENGVI